jgi:predicted amidohydrolase YtcJ
MKRAFLLVTLLACGVASAQLTQNIVLTNCRVFLPNSPDEFAQAIAIKGDRIAGVGKTEEMIALAPHAKRIDCGGRFVIPGINDAHVHFGIVPGFSLITTPDSTFDDVKLAIAGAVDETPPDVFIFGTIGPAVFLDPQATRVALDTAAPGRRIMLTEFTGHGAILSTAAFAALGASAPADPIGGSFERDANGALTGRVFEYAQWGLQRKLADSTGDPENIEALLRLSDEALTFGITTLQIMPAMAALRFESLVQQAHPAVRVRLMRIPITDAANLNFGDNRGGGIGAVKWILDGTPVEQGAALRTNYLGTGLSGRINFTDNEIRQILNDAVRNKEQPLLHVAGDRTVERVVKVMNAMGPAEWPDRRPRIEHGDGVQRDLVNDVFRLGVTVVQNPTHFPFRHFYPDGDYMLLKTLLSRGIHLALGSDGPLNPYLNIQLAVTHPEVPAEKITVNQALTAYTAGSAFAEKLSDKGSLAAGQLADIAVLSNNLFKTRPEDMPAVRSVLTIVNGKIVFDAGVLP